MKSTLILASAGGRSPSAEQRQAFMNRFAKACSPDFDPDRDLQRVGVANQTTMLKRETEEIGRLFKGRIAFWGEIDRQRVLPSGTEADARAAVRRVADALYDPAGGVIAQFEFGPSCRLANAHAVHDEWNRIASVASC